MRGSCTRAGLTLLTICVVSVLGAGVPKHSHQHTNERVEDGSHSPRDASHYDGDGEHHSEFDHEAILGSAKEAEEFDHLSPVESKRRLSVLVTKMDLNSDQFVDRHELKAWILRSFRMLSEEEAGDRLEEIDADKDGRVSWPEYLQDTYGFESMDEAMANEESTEDEKRLIQDDKKMFDMADVNADRQLEAVEFTMFLSPEEFPEMMPIILEQTLRDKDLDKDGRINFQEFIGESAKHHDKEWLVVEKDKFDADFDKDKNGYLQGHEILSWVVPSNE